MSELCIAPHPLLAAYLQYVKNTESPPLFHIWSALCGIAATLGRRCALERADGPLFANMFVILCGPAATRKSTALKYTKKLLEGYTSVRFAPNDTGGQRQGLIQALNGRPFDDEKGDEINEKAKRIVTAAMADSEFSMKRLTEEALNDLGNTDLDLRDPHSLFIVAYELNSILGENNTQMLTFLQQMYDGDDYTYRLRNSEAVIKDTILNAIGCATPTQISLSIPAAAIGQGFMSRIIFVYEDKIMKIPEASLDTTCQDFISSTYSRVCNDLNGSFKFTPAARSAINDLYMRGVNLNDPRFAAYCDRRGTAHIYKVAMCLAAARVSLEITINDVLLADQLLSLTEERMTDALGEYGMNKLSAAKQKLIEHIRGSADAIPYNALFGQVANDMSAMDFRNVIQELGAAMKIKLVNIESLGGLCIIGTADRGGHTSRKAMPFVTALLGKQYAPANARS